MITKRFSYRLFCLGTLMIISTCFTLSAYGQLQLGLNKDSLRRVIQSGINDTNRVKNLITLGQQYESDHPDSALALYRRAGQLSERLNYIPGIIKYISNYTAVLNVQGKFDESLRLNLQAVALSRKHKLQFELAKSLINTGAVYQYTEDYQQAANYYLQALPMVLASDNLQYQSLVYGNLCGLYRNLKQPEKAVEYARSALAIARKAGDQYAEVSASINWGNALKDLKRSKEALHYLLRAQQLSKQINDQNLEQTALINIGDAYLQLGDIKRYTEAYRQALPMARAIGDASGTAFAMQGIALGLFNSKQYVSARLLLDTGITYAREYDQKEILSRMLLLMSDTQIALGNLDNAQSYRAQYDSVTNALLNTPLLKNIQELETRYETEKRKRELAEKNRQLEKREHDSKRQSQWLIASLTGLVVLCFVVILIYRLYLQKQQLNLQEQARIKLNSTLAGEQQERRRISQEIHDDLGAGLTRMLFLSRSLTPGSAADKLATAAEDLIKKMNEVIWMMNDGQDNLAGLTAHLRKTIAEQLDQAGIEHRFEVSDHIADQPLSQPIKRHVYLAVKEATHNIVKHANATHVFTRVDIADKLIIMIHDNGWGLTITNNHTGNGLRNMQWRMEQLNGSLDIVVDNGTQLTFSIPIA